MLSRYGGWVPLVAAAVCPHPPLLVPEVAGAAAPELDDLRAACDVAVARLLAAGLTDLVVGGAAVRPPVTVRAPTAPCGRRAGPRDRRWPRRRRSTR